jgi:hypothetical protein
VVIRYGQIPQSRSKTTLDEEFVNIASVAQFHIRGGREIIVSLKPGVTSDLVRVLLSGRIMAYLLRQRGWLPLHASAVRVKNEAVLFVAPVGRGKSTTAAAFFAKGFPVLSDDVAPVRLVSGKIILCCGEARLRLCEDSAKAFRTLDPAATTVYDKHQFYLPDSKSDQLLPVARVYILTDGHHLNIEHVPTLESASVLGRECFIKLHRSGPEVLKAHLRDCAMVVSHTAIRRLVRPRSFEVLNALVDLVRNDVQSSSLDRGYPMFDSQRLRAARSAN